MPCDCPFCRNNITWLNKTLDNLDECNICYIPNINKTTTQCCNQSICYKCIINMYINKNITKTIPCKLCKIYINLKQNFNIYENGTSCIVCNNLDKNENYLYFSCCNKYACAKCIHNYYMLNITILLDINCLNSNIISKIKKRVNKINYVNEMKKYIFRISNNKYFTIYINNKYRNNKMYFSCLEYEDILHLSKINEYISETYKENDRITINIIFHNFNKNELIFIKIMKDYLNKIYPENYNLINNFEFDIEVYKTSNILNDDKYITLLLLTNNIYIYNNCSKLLNIDIDIIELILTKDIHNFIDVPVEIKNNTCFINNYLKKNIKLVEFLEINNNIINIIIENIQFMNNQDFEYILNDLRLNKIRIIVLSILQKNGLLLSKLHNSLKNDNIIILTAINNNPFSYEFVNNNLKECYEIYMTALTKNINVFKLLPKNLKTNIDILDFAIRHGVCFQHIHYKYLYDRSSLIDGVKNNSKNIKYIPLRYINDINLYYEIVSSNNDSLKYLTNDNMIIELLKKDNTLFNYISPILKGNYEFIKKLIQIIPVLINYINSKSKIYFKLTQ